MKFLLAILLSLSVIFTHQKNQGIKKVKDMNVLMPQVYDDVENRQIIHDLEAYSGCYSWKSSNNQHLNLKQISDENNQNCASICQISLKSSQDLNNVIWITATDQITGDNLRVEANIKPIKRIEILTKFRTIDVGDIQIFELIGFDEEGNSFSSLEGMRFDWTIQQGDNFLDFVPLKDSSIQTTQLRKQLENFHHPHFFTDMVGVKGIRTGKTFVTAKLNEKSYLKYNIQHTVEIHVIEQFIVYPYHPLKFLPNSHFNYQLFYKPKSIQLQQNVAYDKIILPNRNYNWAFNETLLSDSKSKSHSNSFATIFQDQDGNKNEGLLQVHKSQGKGVWQTIYIKDVRSQLNTKKVQYTVVEPHHIDIQIKEYQETDFYNEKPITMENQVVFENSWHLVKGRQYYIRAELYDEDNHLIHIAQNTPIKFQIDETHYKIEKKTHRGQIVVTPRKLGKQIPIFASLESYKNIKKEKISEIVLPIILITPSSIILPTNSNNQQQYYYLQYLGGSRKYTLSSENNAIARVSETSQAIVGSEHEGTTFVTVSDRNNPKNFVKIQVEVSPVDSVNSLEQQKEVLENSLDYIYPVALTKKGEIFNNCTILNFQMIKNENLEIAINQEPINYKKIIQSLQKEKQEFQYMKELLVSESISTAKFDEYIQDNQITKQNLIQIIQELENHGVCRKLNIQGTYIGSQIIQLTELQQNKQQLSEYYRSFDVKVLRKFENIWQKSDLEQQLVSQQKGKYDRIVLAHGATFDWHLQGGLDLWPNRNHQFQYEIYNQKSKQNQPTKNEITFSDQTMNTTFTCNMPSSFTENQNYENDYYIQLQAQNQADIKLPKPVKFEHKLDVSCSIPYSVHIYEFNTTSGKFSDEYREKLSSQDMLYIKNNQLNNLKVKAFDRNSQLFYNYTSLKFQWSLSNNNFGSISQNPKLSGSNELFQDIFQQFESKNIVTQSNTDLILRVQTVTFKQHRPQFNQVWDQVGLRILNNVKLVPSQLRLYKYHNPNLNFTYNVNIVDGFGPFQVGLQGESLTNRVISMHHSSYRGIQVTPLKHGKSKIYADDFKTLGSETAFSDVVVEDVQHLHISIEQNLIPEFNRTVVKVIALGEFGEEFFEESYKYMDIHLEAELVHSSNGKTESEHIMFTRHEDKPNLFTVQGKRRGLYKITAILTENQQTPKKSNNIELEVFSKLWADPGQIIMAPGCELGLQLKGGPSDLSNIALESTNLKGKEKIVEIIQIEEKKLFVVKAKQEFQSEIIFTLYKQDLVLTSVTVPIKIVPVQNAKIIGTKGQRVLHLGTQIRLIAELYNDDYLMNMQVCDYKIEWESESENVLRLFHQENIYPQNSEYSHFENQKNFQLAINTSALDTGKSQVSFKLYTSDDRQIKSATKLIEIIPHLANVQPTYIAKDDVEVEPVHTILLLPPNSRYILNPNKKFMNYQLFNTNDDSGEDKFELDQKTGELFARTNKQRITGTIKIHDQELNEFMIINVQTANIESIFVQNSHTVFRLPQEKDAKLRIHLQDTLGRSFPTSLIGVKLGVSVTNSRVLEGSISSDLKYLNIRTKSSGFSLIKVFLQENPNVYDIFRINVGSIITPESPINILIGGKINFQLSDKSIGQSQLRNWSSQDKSILTIDPIKGNALAKKQGEVIVETSDVMTHQARVVVSKIHELLPLGNSENILTDMKKSHFYQDIYELQFHVISQDPNGKKSTVTQLKSLKSNAEINNDLTFVCEIENKQHAQWFTVQSQAKFDEFGNQIPTCIISLPPISTHLGTTSQAPDLITLTNTLRSSDGQVRFQQRFEYNLQWLVKSKDYNENKQSNDNNNGQQQQNNQQQQQQQQQEQQSENNQSDENRSVSVLDHVTVILMILISAYFWAAKNNNTIDLSLIIYIALFYLCYYLFVTKFFNSSE